MHIGEEKNDKNNFSFFENGQNSGKPRNKKKAL